jgi:hypothetical protein
MQIPYLDLKSQYLAIKDEVHAAIGEVMEKTAFAKPHTEVVDPGPVRRTWVVGERDQCGEAGG